MSGTRAVLVLLLWVLAAPRPASAGQAVPAHGDPAPPVLSTVPTPPAGAQPQAGNMSGLPLQVGDLPPGTVAIRVVRQPFTNVVGERVELRVGAGGPVRTATTGDDGRARFDGLAVGDEVQASATVDGERLDSQRFTLPPRGGVRVLLLAGASGADMAGPAPAAVAAPAPEPPSPSTEPSSPVAASVLAAVFGFTAVVVWWSAMRKPASTSMAAPPPAAAGAAAPGPAPGAPRPSRAALLAERERLYAELAQLEVRATQDGSAADHEAHRAVRLAALERVCAQLGEPVD